MSLQRHNPLEGRFGHLLITITMFHRLLPGPVLLLAGFVLACGGDATSPGPGPEGVIAISLTGFRPLDATREGSYEAWVINKAGELTSAGRFVPAADGTVSLPAPSGSAAGLVITVEPPGDMDALPSARRLLTGTLSGGRATLGVEGAVTQGTLSLKQTPGQFTMFSPSDNLEHGYPSYEESGVWLFNMAPRETPQNDMWVRLTQIRDGWTYEGWMVRDYGLPGAIWLSYGKFRPDQAGVVNSRDNTGWGPFSGVLDFLTAGEEDFPGDDWISNPLGYPLPPGLVLPLNLREKTGQGQPRWTHVITIEPASDLGEAIGSERPFLVVPYHDPFGDGGPGVPRTITFDPAGVPRGSAVLR